MKKKLLNIMLSLLMLISLININANRVLAEDPAGVVRSGECRETENKPLTGNNTFVKDAPIGTITINTTEMNANSSNLTMSSTNTNIYLGRDEASREGLSGYAKNFLFYAPNGFGDDATSVASGQTANVDGTITLTWQDIAVLQDGSIADVTMEISNLFFDKPKIAVRDSSNVVTGYTDTDAKGPIGIFSNGGFLGPRFVQNAEGDSAQIGMTATVKVYVSQDGNQVPGSILFSTFDLDIIDPIYKDASDNPKYNEGFKIVNGAISPAYIPESNNTIITGSGSSSSANGLKFEATAGDNNSYKTGFVVLIDNGAGVTLDWQGKGNGMGTKLFTGNISHYIDSRSTKGGSITTTTTGDLNSGDELGQGRLDVPDGKDVSYLMEPEEGYKLGKLLVDGQEVDPDDSSTWPEYLTITKNPDGSVVATFNDNNANHKIFVSWDPEIVGKSKDGGTISDKDKEEYIPGEMQLDDQGNPVLDEDGNIKRTPGKKIHTVTPNKNQTLGTITYNGQNVDPRNEDTWPKDDQGNPLMNIIENPDGTFTIETTVDEPTEIEVSFMKTHWVKYIDPLSGEPLLVFEDGIFDSHEPPAPKVSHEGYWFAEWVRTVDADGNITYTAKWFRILPPPVPNTSAK